MFDKRLRETYRAPSDAARDTVLLTIGLFALTAALAVALLFLEGAWRL